VEEENQKDFASKRIMEELRRNPDSHGNHTLENGILHYKGRLVLSSSSSWILKLLQEYHATPMGRHNFRTYRRIAQSLHWMGMKKTIYVLACLVCEQNKYQVCSPQGLLQPVPIPRAIWEEKSMDFIVRLPKSNGKDAILVVVDRLSKLWSLHSS